MIARVNEYAIGNLYITLSSPVANSLYSATVTFPPELTVDNVTTIYSLNCRGDSFPFYDRTGNTIGFRESNFFITNYQIGKTCDMSFVKVKAPTSTKPTSSFTVEIYRNGFIVNRINSGLTYTCLKGIIMTASLSTSNTVIGEQAIYSFTI